MAPLLYNERNTAVMRSLANNHYFCCITSPDYHDVRTIVQNCVYINTNILQDGGGDQNEEIEGDEQEPDPTVGESQGENDEDQEIFPENQNEANPDEDVEEQECDPERMDEVALEGVEEVTMNDVLEGVTDEDNVGKQNDTGELTFYW